MSTKDNRHLRLVSPGPGTSDGNSSMRVVEASSNRAQSTTPLSRVQSPEPSSLSGQRPHPSSQTAPLRNRSSMEDDLRGVDSRASPHGVKRSRSEVSDGEDSDDEPGPKRDRLLEELCDLQANNLEDGTFTDLGDPKNDEVRPDQNYLDQRIEDRILPLRRMHRQVEQLPRTGGRNQQQLQDRAPTSTSVDGSQMEGRTGKSQRTEKE